MAFKFEYVGRLSNGRFFDEDSSKKVVVELNDNDMNVHELLNEFMNFLKAAGYPFDIDDRLDIVNDFVNNEDHSSTDANHFNTSNTGEELINPPHG